MTFCLAGFASITESAVGFLIPFFSRSGTNANFVQELDGDYNIVEFARFDVEVYRTVGAATGLILKKPGDRGILAFSQRGNVVWGDFETLKSKITTVSAKADASRSPFLDLEVAQFLGDTNREELAITAGRALFNDLRRGEIWGRTEAGRVALGGKAPSVSKILAPHSERRQPNDFFDQPLDTPGWEYNWSRRWDAGERDDRMVALAYDWLTPKLNGKAFDRDSNFVYEETSAVLRRAYAARPAEHSMIRLVSTWLSGASRRDNDWVDILLRAIKYDRGSTLHKNLALSFLRNDIENVSRACSIGAWVTVFVTAKNRHYLSVEEAANLAEKAFESMSGELKFLSNVITPLVEERLLTQALYRPLLDAMLALARPNLRWVKVVRRLVAAARYPDLVELAAEMVLKEEMEPELRGSFLIVVHEGVTQSIRFEFIEMADDWLLDRDADEAQWADLFLARIRHSTPKREILSVASFWVGRNRNHRRAVEVERFLAGVPRPAPYANASLELGWTATVSRALEALGGEATLNEIYSEIEASSKRDLPMFWRSIVRRTLGDGSLTSSHFRGEHLFDRLDRGKWRSAHMRD